MTENPIVEEIHRIREQMLAECGGDMKMLMDNIRKREEESARAGRKVVIRNTFPRRHPGG